MHLTERAKNLILGALVADTAAMGTHWIYDQDRIRKIAPETPEFIAPDATNYAGVPAYFAHAARAPGQTSQYGEQAIVMLNALIANNGAYDPHTFAEHFRSHFGYGGGWVGYIDHATRDTLDNFVRAQDDALAAARAIPSELPEKTTKALVGTVMGMMPRQGDDDLRQKVEEVLRQSYEDEATVAHGLRIFEALATLPPRYGAVDEQMPATAKLPSLVAALGAAEDQTFLTAVDTAVRTTSDHPNAQDLGRVCARIMQAALATDDLDSIITAGHTAGSAQAQALIDQARVMTDQDNPAVARHFGMSCELTYGVPTVVHNILTAPSYTDAIRRNIYAGGDTCGRAIILGSILGAVYGVDGDRGIPTDWIDQMRIDPTVLDLLR